MKISTTAQQVTLRIRLATITAYIRLADWRADRAWAAKNRAMKRHERLCDLADWAEGEARVLQHRIDTL